MQFGVLGPVTVRRADGTSVDVGAPKVRALLVALLRDPGAVVGFERLVDDVYGEQVPADAGNALQSQVSRLRRTLGASQLVERYPDGYRLAVDPEQVDAHRFERLVAEGRAEPDRARAVTVLRSALALWRGPVHGMPRLDELRAECTELLAATLLTLGEHEDVVPLLRRLLEAHPLRERPRAMLVTALHGAGRAAEALTEFARARRLLAEELGADPGAELAAAHLAVLRAAPVERRARPLPLQLTSFIGRESELDQVGELLARHRLVTLTGPGGAGKTRLALQVADRHEDDVALVELAPLDEGADLAQAVLDALGLRESAMLGRGPRPSRSAHDRLAAALADRSMLLVLDNCEHLVAAAARLVHVLVTACPGLRVLATSREVLRIGGEVVCPVRSLPAPPPDPDGADPLAYSAMRLFVERAAAVRPGFRLDAAVDPAAVDAVARICRALDGQPLAIELAAARVSTLAPQDIAARLTDGAAGPDAGRFALLSRGPRTADARHRTLYAVVEWSWDLLEDDERELAARFTVFAGGATLEAVTTVCGDAETLAGLVEKSLVEAGADGRYRMLETIRSFCAQRLVESGRGEEVRRAHARYHLDLARSADPWLRTGEQLHWLRVLVAEHDNLATAIRWAARADHRMALRLLSMLAHYFWLAGRKGEGAGLAAVLLARLPTEPPPGMGEEYVICVCTAAVGRADATQLRDELGRASAIVHAMTQPPRQPFVMMLWGSTVGLPRHDVTEQLVLRSELHVGNPWNEALSRLGFGLLAVYRGELPQARERLTAAAQGFRTVGDRWGLALVLSELSVLTGWVGDRAGSVALTAEALALTELVGASEEQAELLCRRADGNLRAGDLDAAGADFTRATELSRRVGAPDTLAAALAGLGDVDRLAGRAGEADARFAAALASCSTGMFGSEEARTRAYIGLGRLAEERGDLEEAERRHRQALGSAVGTRSFIGIASAVEALAGVALGRADPERAALLLGAGAAMRGTSIAGDPDVARSERRATAALGVDRYRRAYRGGAALERADIVRAVGADPSTLGG